MEPLLFGIFHPHVLMPLSPAHYMLDIRLRRLTRVEHHFAPELGIAQCGVPCSGRHMHAVDIGGVSFGGDGAIGTDVHTGARKWEDCGVVPGREPWSPVSVFALELLAFLMRGEGIG